jgi:hypothetical protein
MTKPEVSLLLSKLGYVELVVEKVPPAPFRPPWRATARKTGLAHWLLSFGTTRKSAMLNLISCVREAEHGRHAGGTDS